MPKQAFEPLPDRQGFTIIEFRIVQDWSTTTFRNRPVTTIHTANWEYVYRYIIRLLRSCL